jgi:para-aminobenzoate synthetase component 1
MSSKYIKRINSLVASKEPFLFIINYKKDEVVIQKIKDIDPNEILFSINGVNNIAKDTKMPPLEFFRKYPVSFSNYSKSFAEVEKNLRQGNSYLINLTFETPIETNLTLKQIFYKSKAPYKLWYYDKFVVFSPEIFVKIIDGKIKSFPMKGTVDANIPNAKELVLDNAKEQAEHATIVDLIRNDLSKVATHVEVERYRYIDRIKTNNGDLLQVSSLISGILPKGYEDKIGEVLFDLLPAGSISGAPKDKTLEIIDRAEGYDRGFYTGIFGIFDGESIDSAVMIRFIENIDGKKVFKSGGGITTNSNCNDEYNEMIQKVYLPI